VNAAIENREMTQLPANRLLSAVQKPCVECLYLPPEGRRYAALFASSSMVRCTLPPKLRFGLVTPI
jgi:hypothetical protein